MPVELIELVGLTARGCAALPEIVAVGAREPPESATGMVCALVAPPTAPVELVTVEPGIPDEVAAGLVGLGTAAAIGGLSETLVGLVEPVGSTGVVWAIPLAGADESAMAVGSVAGALDELEAAGCTALAAPEVSG